MDIEAGDRWWACGGKVLAVIHPTRTTPAHQCPLPCAICRTPPRGAKMASYPLPPYPPLRALETTYRHLHCELDGRTSIELPPAYPTGVLLGCVEVVDCIQAGPGVGEGAAVLWCGCCEQSSQQPPETHPPRGATQAGPLDHGMCVC